MNDVTLKGNRIIETMVDIIREAKSHLLHGGHEAVMTRLETIETMALQLYQEHK